ncbi:hypothetical protein V1227_11190 [Lentzea sp. DG1S-22]|uniref:hypothetical protein n=1 Tax=Lentzea sp. DG1S-22 TaxID=3108822 RepID=UPI002E79E720|nr:hypothetical protein [Lentzea sp. DG1S-22]WVH83285.1 hypothetical protein V1227_11190 [Lentzea sp. DG1S-22]
MPRDLVAGASADAVEALRAPVSGLPAAMMVVPHIPARGSSALSTILARSGSLSTSVVADLPRERLDAGRAARRSQRRPGESACRTKASHSPPARA